MENSTGSVNFSNDVVSTTEWFPLPTVSNASSQLNISTECLVLKPGQFVPWDNPENLIGYEAQKLVNDILKGLCVPICFLVSVPTNILNMLVFYKQGLKERVNLCLFFLAFSDFTIVTAYFVFNSGIWLSKITNDPPLQTKMARFFIHSPAYILSGYMYVSGFLSAVIACERCLCVINPLRFQTLLKTRTMALIIFVGHIVILGPFYMVSKAFTTICVYDPVKMVTTEHVTGSKFYQDNNELLSIYQGYIVGLGLPGSCVAAVSISTIITVMKLKQMAKWRTESASAAAGMAARDIALTRMLVGIGILFIVCITPGLVTHTSSFFIEGLNPAGRYHNTFMLLLNFQLMFVFINSSLNFFIYYKTGSKFRSTLRSLFGKHQGKTWSKVNSVSETALQEISKIDISSG